MTTAAEGRQIKSNQTANKKKLQILNSTKIVFGEFMCTLSGKISFRESNEFFWKFQHFCPTKFSTISCLFFAVGEQVEFSGDKSLWICWKPSSPRKLIHSKINIVKVYLLEVKKIRNKETATYRSTTNFCFAKSYYIQHSFEEEMNQFCTLHSSFVLINLEKCL